MSLLQGLLNAAGGQISMFSPLGRWARAVGRVAEESSAFLVQTDWAVDALNGNDLAEGSLARPLKSLPELAKRLQRPFHPDVTLVSVRLIGAFSDALVLQPVFTNLSAGVHVQGQMNTLHEGLVTTFTADSAVSNTRAEISESGVDLSVFVGKRVRITSGPNTGAVAFIAAANGQAVFVSHFMKFSLMTGTASGNPAPGDSYVIEDFATSFPSYKVRVLGGTISELSSFRLDGGRTSYFEVDGGYGTVFGVDYAPPAFLLLTGSHSQTCCQYSSGTISLLGSDYLRQLSCLCRTPIYVDDGAYVAAYYNTHQGPNATLSVSTGATLEDLGHRGFFGVGGIAALSVQYVGRYFQLHAVDRLWGSGNTSTNILKVTGGSSVALFAAPTATGSGGDAIIGGVSKTWAELPYIDIGAGTNNSGAMVVFQT